MSHPRRVSGVLGFPNPVNEKAARTVAALVALSCLLALVTVWRWLLVPIAYGFWARVDWAAAQPVRPDRDPGGGTRLGAAELVPGPPKRFAQTIGAVVTTTAAVSSLVLGWTTFASALLVMMVVFATLESALGFCVGCRIFAVLMRVGVMPWLVCMVERHHCARCGPACGRQVVSAR